MSSRGMKSSACAVQRQEKEHQRERVSTLIWVQATLSTCCGVAVMIVCGDVCVGVGGRQGSQGG